MLASKRRVALAWLLAASVGTAMSVEAQQSGPPSPSQSGVTGEPARKAPPSARSGKAADPKDKGDTASAQDNVEAGIKALEAGKIDAAVASLTSALSASTLPSAQTARALYYRGLAYRRQSKPALAIADLTSALWLKGGLTDQQRQDALQNRAAAYREAGLPDQAEADYARSASAGAGSPAQSAPAAPPSSTALATQALPGAASGAGTAPRPGVGAKAIERTPELTTDAFGSRTAQSASASPSAPAPVPAPTQPAVASAPEQQKSSGGMGGFFGSLFGGGSSAGSQTQPAVASAPPAQVAGPWSMRTQVTSSSVPQSAQPAPAIDSGRVAVASLPTAAAPKTPVPPARPASVAAAPALAPANGGAYRVQVATLRSHDEALGVAAMFQDRYGRELGNRSAAVDQTVMGNMGTLYRVRIGPFATANETRQMCERLKRDGHDCMVVTQAQ